jgi:hypothetical protein
VGAHCSVGLDGLICETYYHPLYSRKFTTPSPFKVWQIVGTTVEFVLKRR